jgi:hypothetical protein
VAIESGIYFGPLQTADVDRVIGVSKSPARNKAEEVEQGRSTRSAIPTKRGGLLTGSNHRFGVAREDQQTGRPIACVKRGWFPISPSASIKRRRRSHVADKIATIRPELKLTASHTSSGALRLPRMQLVRVTTSASGTAPQIAFGWKKK